MLSDRYPFRIFYGKSFTIAGYSLLLALILLFLTPNLNSEEERDTGWDQAPISTDNDLNDVLSFNSTSAFAVGENGKIFYTSNSGSNWSEQESGVIQDLNAINFNGQLVVVGDSGTVLINENSSWVDNSIEGAGNLYDLSIPHFASIEDSTIFVSGTEGEIWKWNNNKFRNIWK